MTAMTTKTPAKAPAEASQTSEAPSPITQVLHNNTFEVIDNTDEAAPDAPQLGKVESEYELLGGLVQVNYV